MKKITGTMICNLISAALVLGFLVNTAVDYYRYSTTLNSAPFSLWIAVNLICFILPAILVFFCWPCPCQEGKDRQKRVMKNRINKEVGCMKKLLAWILAAILLMIGLPWLAVTFAADAGMAICFLLFFAVNPLFSVACGIFAGGNIRRRWVLPILTAGLFLAGVWLFFDMGETAFLGYCGCYLALGVIAMLIRAMVKKRAQ